MLSETKRQAKLFFYDMPKEDGNKDEWVVNEEKGMGKKQEKNYVMFKLNEKLKKHQTKEMKIKKVERKQETMEIALQNEKDPAYKYS